MTPLGVRHAPIAGAVRPLAMLDKGMLELGPSPGGHRPARIGVHQVPLAERLEVGREGGGDVRFAHVHRRRRSSGCGRHHFGAGP